MGVEWVAGMAWHGTAQHSTDLAALAGEGTEVEARRRLSAHLAQLVHLERKAQLETIETIADGVIRVIINHPVTIEQLEPRG